MIELVPITMIIVIAWIATGVITNARKAKAMKIVADLHARVLDKCASSQDLIAYLESPSGQRFLQSATTETSNPMSRILSAIQAGFILLLAGAAELLVRLQWFGPDADRFLVLTGAIALAIGAGFLLSAASSFALCKSWGLLPTQHAAR